MAARGPRWLRRLRFSPLGESLSFASPKESNQRKGDPTSLPSGFPIGRARPGASPTRPGTGHKTPRAAELGHGSAFSPPARAKSAALKGSNPRCRSRVVPILCHALAHAGTPLVCCREAQPPEGKRGWVSELRSRARFVCPARASCAAAPMARFSRGGAAGSPSFGYFSWRDKKSD